MTDLPIYGFRPDLGGLLGLAVTVLLPLLVGLATTRATGAGLKATLLLGLAAVKSVLEAWLQASNTGVPFEAIPVVYATAVSFGIAVAVHFGLFKPAGLSAVAQSAGAHDRRPRPAPLE
jgi:hypothetical protein